MLAVVLVLVFALSLSGCGESKFVVGEKDGIAFARHSGKTPEITLSGQETKKKEAERLLETLAKTVDGKPIAHERGDCGESRYCVYVDLYIFFLCNRGIIIEERYGWDKNGLIDVGVVACSEDEMEALFSMLETDE